MIRRARTGSITFADFLELIREDQKADLIDGVIHLASPENIEHGDLIFWLGKLLDRFVAKRKLGKVMLNRIAYRLSDHTAPEPDVAFVCAARLGLLKKNHVAGAPDLAVEIVSPESVERDYEAKRLKYEEAGVQEYWIIDPEDQTVLFFVRGLDGFEEASADEHVFRSRVIPVLELDVRWLWQRPLPDAFDLAQDMLDRCGRASGSTALD